MYQVGDEYEVPADVFSVFNKRQYAAKGSLVKVVSVHGHVMILERKDGFRFPLAIASLAPIEKPKSTYIEPDPVPSKKKTVIRSVPVQKTQQTLF